MAQHDNCICLRDTLKQDKQEALDEMIAKFGIEDIFRRNIGNDETNTVSFPCPDTYIEVVFSNNKLQSLHGDEIQLLEDIGNELQEIMDCNLGLTSHPGIMHNGSAIYQVGYTAVRMSDTK